MVTTMSSQDEKARQFLALHQPGDPLLLPNPWDPGSAKILASLGYQALATTSSGSAAALGKLDGQVTRDEALAHSTAVVAATSLPVSADLENCFADDPEGVAETVTLAAATGLAGLSIEDFTRNPDAPIYELRFATARVAAAAEAAHRHGMVLTARCENLLHGVDSLDDTIMRLQSYSEAGADVLFAPGLSLIDDIRRVVAETDRPVNVLALASVPPIAELAEAGVSRVSVGGGFAAAAYGALTEAAVEFRVSGTYEFTGLSAIGRSAIARAANA
jgi:2-methylisocitrate lyase-like PEP mutase family enzyme